MTYITELTENLSSDAILNMVNNIAVNVLGGGPEMQGMSNTTTESSVSFPEMNLTEPSPQLGTTNQTTASDLTSVSV